MRPQKLPLAEPFLDLDFIIPHCIGTELKCQSPLDQGLGDFFLKGLIVNIFGFKGHGVSFSVTQFYCCGMKEDRQYVSKWLCCVPIARGLAKL